MSRITPFFLGLFILMMPFIGGAGQFLGGELTYRLVSSGGGSYTYEVKLKVYRECSNPAEFDNPVLKIINSLDLSKNTHPLIYREVDLADPVKRILPKSKMGYCVVNDPQTCIEEYTFTRQVDLATSPEGYTIYYNSCCRNGISNLTAAADNFGSELIYNVPVPGQAFTFAAFIPSHDSLANNSPVSVVDSVIMACKGKPLNYRFQYRDADGDSIVIRPTSSLSKVSVATTIFPPLIYKPGYTVGQPIGNGVTISTNGEIAGIPQSAGLFAVAIQLEEYRNGKLINKARKDFQLDVFDCEIKAPANIINCQTNVALFENPNNVTNTFLWDFGVPDYIADTSVSKDPVYLYPQIGTFRVKLIVENTVSGCRDSVFTIAKMYPGALKPDFDWEGITCQGYPITLHNRSQVAAGTSIQSYLWRVLNTNTVIGNTASFSYTPQVTGTQPYPLAVNLIIQSDLGCKDSVLKDILIYEKVVADAGPDRILSFGETYQINGLTTPRFATYEWSPAYGLSNATVRNPVVQADRDITYTLKVENPGGCSDIDTVRFRYMKGPEIYVATAFTPNEDGLNDVLNFFPVGMESFVFTVYNRWGQIVFTSSDINKGWDGKVKGILQNPDTFLWKIQATDLQGKLVLKKGYVQLLR